MYLTVPKRLMMVLAMSKYEGNYSRRERLDLSYYNLSPVHKFLFFLWGMGGSRQSIYAYMIRTQKKDEQKKKKRKIEEINS